MPQVRRGALNASWVNQAPGVSVVCVLDLEVVVVVEVPEVVVPYHLSHGF